MKCTSASDAFGFSQKRESYKGTVYEEDESESSIAEADGIPQVDAELVECLTRQLGGLEEGGRVMEDGADEDAEKNEDFFPSAAENFYIGSESEGSAAASVVEEEQEAEGSAAASVVQEEQDGEPQNPPRTPPPEDKSPDPARSSSASTATTRDSLARERSLGESFEQVVALAEGEEASADKGHHETTPGELENHANTAPQRSTSASSSRDKSEETRKTPSKLSKTPDTGKRRRGKEKSKKPLQRRTSSGKLHDKTSDSNEWHGWTLMTDQCYMFYHHQQRDESVWEMPKELAPVLGEWTEIFLEGGNSSSSSSSALPPQQGGPGSSSSSSSTSANKSSAGAQSYFFNRVWNLSVWEDPRLTSDVFTAVTNGNSLFLQLFHESGGDLKLIHPSSGATLLHYAVSAGNAEIVSYLLEKSAEDRGFDSGESAVVLL